MSTKRTKKPADNEVDDLFEGIGDDSAPKKTAPASKPKPATSKTKGSVGKGKAEQDILADLESELEKEPAPRPHTPRIKDAGSKRTSTATPPPAAVRRSEDKLPRKSTESTRSFHASFTPSATSSELQDSEKKGSSEQTAAGSSGGGGGGWWGGIFATASATANAAIKQAEAAYKEIQKNEEAKKWAEQVRGNVGALKGLGDDLRHRALPTFAEIMHTLAPPISSHERLLIHITHDIVGYPSLDPLIYDVFSRVMSQVEGGDLLVIQRGQESTARRPSSSASDAAFYKGGSSSRGGAGSGGKGGGSSAAGWRDGPWWRQADAPRDLGAVAGLVEGTKLCRASAEGYARDYFAPRGGITEAQRRALEPVSEDNPVRTSDIFLAVQAINVGGDGAGPALFGGGTTTAGKEKEKSEEDDDDNEPAAAANKTDDAQVCFAVYVLDPVHEIVYSTVSQGLPARWIRWLDTAGDGDAGPTPHSEEDEEDDEDEDDEDDEDDDEDDDDDDDDESEAGGKASAKKATTDKEKSKKPTTTTTKSSSSTAAGGVPAEIREIIEGGGVDPREWVAEWVEEALSLSIGVLAQRYVARRMGVGESAGDLSGGRHRQKVEAIVNDGAGEAARAGLI